MKFITKMPCIGPILREALKNIHSGSLKILICVTTIQELILFLTFLSPVSPGFHWGLAGPGKGKWHVLSFWLFAYHKERWKKWKCFSQTWFEELHLSMRSATHSRGVQVEVSALGIHFRFIGVSSVTVKRFLNSIWCNHKMHLHKGLCKKSGLIRM